MTHAENALVIFARVPVPGRVKTRLSPDYSPDEACEIHRALVADVVERSARAVGGTADLFLAWSEPVAAGAAVDAVPSGVVVEAQSSGDLGERMAFAMQGKLRAGYRRAVLLGSDSPTLPADHLLAAFDALREADVVLGPSDDGGYYLVGMSRLHVEIFRGIEWGSDGVLGATRARLKRSGTPYVDLGMWHDVDTPEDVARLFEDLRRMKARRAPDFPARTYATLTRLVPTRPGR
ncbi:MAG: TIGR04282 family arsenosugar biosynthesis glycosyltransferase [Acidobacteria bacterium]|nr:TIGR04282 family arsenosugar biosynthesis glycosyltransferase [Acidobacteriota bacterium]